MLGAIVPHVGRTVALGLTSLNSRNLGMNSSGNGSPAGSRTLFLPLHKRTLWPMSYGLRFGEQTDARVHVTTARTECRTFSHA